MWLDMWVYINIFESSQLESLYVEDFLYTWPTGNIEFLNL